MLPSFGSAALDLVVALVAGLARKPHDRQGRDGLALARKHCAALRNAIREGDKRIVWWEGPHEPASTVARLLLGLVFLVFGLNGFLHFIPNMAMPEPVVTFFAALAATAYMLPLLFTAQIVGGILLLAGIYVSLGLALLAPVIVNIFFFHLFLAASGLLIAIVVVALEMFLVWRYRDAFGTMLRSR